MDGWMNGQTDWEVFVFLPWDTNVGSSVALGRTGGLRFTSTPPKP